MTITLENLSYAEKLQLVEQLWDDCYLHNKEVPSPDWHESYLKDRELAIENGTDEFVDWDSAKEDIRNFRK